MPRGAASSATLAPEVVAALYRSGANENSSGVGGGTSSFAAVVDSLGHAAFATSSVVVRGVARIHSDCCTIAVGKAGRQEIADGGIRGPAFRPDTLAVVNITPAHEQRAGLGHKKEEVGVEEQSASTADADARYLRSLRVTLKPETLHIQLHILRAVGLPKADFLGLADPYVEVLAMSCDPLRGDKGLEPNELRQPRSKVLDEWTLFHAKTQIVTQTLSPVWDEIFNIRVPSGDACANIYLYFRVHDYDAIGSGDFLGHGSVGLLELLEASLDLTPGWKALVRGCSNPEDRLEVLRDERLKSSREVACNLREVAGQEGKYDLGVAQVFLCASICERTPPPLGVVLSAGGAVARRLQASQKPLLPVEIEESAAALARVTARGDIASVFQALCHGVSVNSIASDGEYKGCAPLHIACLEGRGDLAMALVDAFNASLVQRALGGRTASMCACQAGNEALAEWIINEGTPVDARDDVGRTVLSYAAMAALPQLVSWLLGAQRMSPTEQDADQSAPLAAAVGSGKPAASVVAGQLLEAQASANVADVRGRTPLHIACAAGDDRCVRLLLHTGKARIAAVNAAGKTPYDVASPSLPLATLRKLALPPRPIREDGVEVILATDAEQLPGETAEEAERRRLRARKAATSAGGHDWTAWRLMHPRKGGPEDQVIEAERKERLTKEANIIQAEEGGLPEDEIVLDNHGVPLFVGRCVLVSKSKRLPGASRLGRLRNWARCLGKKTLIYQTAGDKGSIVTNDPHGLLEADIPAVDSPRDCHGGRDRFVF